MKIDVKDNNGKEFSLDVDTTIGYINDDMSTDANKMFSNSTTDEKVELTPVDLKIVNANDEPFIITDEDNSGSEIVDIDVYIEASHSGVKINNAFYTGESMTRDADSYTSPFRKPFLTNHDGHSEPLGRITDCDCIDSAILEGSKAINVIAKISDKDAVAKFMDGRYNTVSIGANPKTVICNTCNKSILKDSKFKFCGHMRGETYDEKVCTWNMEDLEYSELSVVNMPADKAAQVYKIKVNTKDSIKANNTTDENKSTLATQILNSVVEEPVVEPTNVVEEGVVILTDNLEELTTTIKTLQDENDALLSENKVLLVDNETLETEINSISNMYMDSMKSLITHANKNITDEEASDFLKVLEIYNTCVNETTIKDSTVKITTDGIVATVTSVTSATPVGLVNTGESGTVTVDDDGNEPEMVVPVKVGDNTNKAKDELNSFFNLYK